MVGRCWRNAGKALPSVRLEATPTGQPPRRQAHRAVGDSPHACVEDEQGTPCDCKCFGMVRVPAKPAAVGSLHFARAAHIRQVYLHLAATCMHAWVAPAQEVAGQHSGGK